MTQTQLNTELDYQICEQLDMTMDELDEVRLPLVQKLRRTILGEVLNALQEV